MANLTVDRRLWLAADRETLVEDGDPDAAFLWAIPGRVVTRDEADRVGYQPAPSAEPELAEPELAEPEPEPETESEPELESEPKRKPGRPRKKAGD